MNPPYDIIYTDNPWHYRGREQFGFAGDVGVSTGGAIKQYPTMKVEELCAMGPAVQQIAAPDCLLFSWCTGPLLLTDQVAVLEAWDFEYATMGFVWDKVLTNPGFYTLSETEFCIVAKRGRIPQPRGARNIRQLVEAFHGEMVTERRTEHSRKPAEVRDRIARMFPAQRKIELFARERVAGWDGWGNQYPAE